MSIFHGNTIGDYPFTIYDDNTTGYLFTVFNVIVTRFLSTVFHDK